jgi:predicted nuclease with TOPRIM domain
MDKEEVVYDLVDRSQETNRELEALDGLEISEAVKERREFLENQVREAYGYIHYVDSL